MAFGALWNVQGRGLLAIMRVWCRATEIDGRSIAETTREDTNSRYGSVIVVMPKVVVYRKHAPKVELSLVLASYFCSLRDLK